MLIWLGGGLLLFADPCRQNDVCFWVSYCHSACRSSSKLPFDKTISALSVLSYDTLVLPLSPDFRVEVCFGIFMGLRKIIDLLIFSLFSLFQRCLLLGRQAVTNLDNILKSRGITLLTNICVVKALVFPAVMCGCERWTIKKAERQRIHAFELWCWRRLLRVHWTARRSNQSILKEISPEYSLEGLMLNWNSNTLATWFEELTH